MGPRVGLADARLPDELLYRDLAARPNFSIWAYILNFESEMAIRSTNKRRCSRPLYALYYILLSLAYAQIKAEYTRYGVGLEFYILSLRLQSNSLPPAYCVLACLSVSMRDSSYDVLQD